MKDEKCQAIDFIGSIIWDLSSTGFPLPVVKLCVGYAGICI